MDAIKVKDSFSWDTGYKSAAINMRDYSLKIYTGKNGKAECLHHYYALGPQHSIWPASKPQEPAQRVVEEYIKRMTQAIPAETFLILWQSEEEAQNALEKEFNELARKWRNETAVFSSITKKSMNYHYLRIIGMGPKVVPLILKELHRSLGHWFVALEAITGENPVKPEEEGDIKKMTKAWKKLGSQQGWI